MRNIDKYREEYLLKIPIYRKLGIYLCESIDLILQESKIDYLQIYYRVKDVDSFIEKIDRKSYKNPFVQTEDICGLRIICYFQKDVKKIVEILKKEIFVKESQDKEELLSIDQFGYRSYHLIASIPESLHNTLKFRIIEGLKAEIQIRTVLMHAWAEIGHKLIYKKKSHIPDSIKRKFYRLSANLEEADEQFQEIKEQGLKIQSNIIQKAINKDINFSKIKKLDLDFFQAYLDYRFPDHYKSEIHTRILFDQIQDWKITLQDIEKGYEKIKPFIEEIEDYFSVIPEKYGLQVSIVRIILMFTNDEYSMIYKLVPSYAEGFKHFKIKYEL